MEMDPPSPGFSTQRRRKRRSQCDQPYQRLGTSPGVRRRKAAGDGWRLPSVTILVIARRPRPIVRIVLLPSPVRLLLERYAAREQYESKQERNRAGQGVHERNLILTRETVNW